MNETPFGQTYADQYDLLYGDKDYEAECDLLCEAFRRWGTGPVESVLDLGCGTGNHAIPLAKRGFQVTGVDVSPGMLAHAEAKVMGWQLPDVVPPVFQHGDVRSVSLGKQFAAVIMMFAVLG